MVLGQWFLFVNHEIPKTFTGDFFEEWKELIHSPNSHKKFEEHLRFFNSKFQSFLLSYKKLPVLSSKQGLQMSYVVETLLIYLSICYDVVKGKVFNRKKTSSLVERKEAALCYGRSATGHRLAGLEKTADATSLVTLSYRYFKYTYRYQMISENNKTGGK